MTKMKHTETSYNRPEVNLTQLFYKSLNKRFVSVLMVVALMCLLGSALTIWQ